MTFSDTSVNFDVCGVEEDAPVLQLLVQGQCYIVALNSKYKGIVCGVEEDAPCAAVAFARSVPLYVYYTKPLIEDF